MKRREFLGIVGVGAFHKLALPKFGAAQQSTASAIAAGVPSIPSGEQAGESKPYGSGHFGEWITDQFGLPAYRYTCNQVTDPKAVTPVHKQWRGPTDHTHQVGNDRMIAAVSNFGYVQVRQDEGSPKFLNDYSPEHSPLRRRNRLPHRWRASSQHLLSRSRRILRKNSWAKAIFGKP